MQSRAGRKRSRLPTKIDFQDCEHLTASELVCWRFFQGEAELQVVNNDVDSSKLFAGNIAIAVEESDTDAALSGFVVALARNQARIDHDRSIGDSNGNTKH